MAIQFPQNPTDGQVYPDYDAGDAPLDNGLVYYWSDSDGAWLVSCDASDEYVKRAGDTMSGFLFLRDNLGETQYATEDAHAANKFYVDSRFREIEEEIDGIAPSVQRGTWYYNGTEVTANRPPGDGFFYLQKNNSGTPSIVSTYAACDQIVMSTRNSAGESIGFGSVVYQDIFSLFDLESDSYVRGEVQSVSNAGTHVIITIVNDASLAQPVNQKLSRLNIYKPPTGGDISDFLKKNTSDQIGTEDDTNLTYKVAVSGGTNYRALRFDLNTNRDQFVIRNKDGNERFKVSYNHAEFPGTAYFYGSTYISDGGSTFLKGKLDVGYNADSRLFAKPNQTASQNNSGSNTAGDAGQVLKSNGASRAPYWGDASATFRYGTETSPSLATGEGYLNTDLRVLYIGL
jgi:hypothetical protein